MLNIIVNILKNSDTFIERAPQRAISTNAAGMRLLHKTYQTRS